MKPIKKILQKQMINLVCQEVAKDSAEHLALQLVGGTEDRKRIPLRTFQLHTALRYYTESRFQEMSY